MKGVVLAGGLGTRLHPLTKITNKHLLPVYDKPMIYYPIRTLINVGIRDILLVTGGKRAGDFLRLLGNGREFGLKHIHYTYQETEGGIADALALAEDFADRDKIGVIGQFGGPLPGTLGQVAFGQGLSPPDDALDVPSRTGEVIAERRRLIERFRR